MQYKELVEIKEGFRYNLNIADLKRIILSKTKQKFIKNACKSFRLLFISFPVVLERIKEGGPRIIILKFDNKEEMERWFDFVFSLFHSQCENIKKQPIVTRNRSGQLRIIRRVATRKNKMTFLFMSMYDGFEWMKGMLLANAKKKANEKVKE